MAHDNQQHRLFFIELIAYWEGQINATTLTNQFELSRQSAAKLLKKYMALAPDNLIYCPSLKAYSARDSVFGLHYINGDVAQYLNWIQTGNIQPQVIHPTLTLSNLALTLPPRQVAPLLMQVLIKAIRMQQRVDVDYVSLSRPDYDGRVITPHSFVNTGLRWHLRAHCEKSDQYRDFVLSRFRGIPELLDESKYTAEQDAAWNTPVEIIVQPNPQLSPAQQDVIANDYQMRDNQLCIITKACLVNYWLQEMHINPNAKTATPEAQPLVVVNKSVLNPWLFDNE